MVSIIVASCGLAALVVVFVALMLWREDRIRATHALERSEWAAERRELNQRIQAPEIATVQAIDVTRDGPAYISPEDDHGFWAEHLARAGDA